MYESSLIRRWSRRLAASLVYLAAGGAMAPLSAADLYGPVAKEARSGGTLNFGSLVEPPGLDPFHQAADARIRFTVLMYQGLFYEGADGEAVPLLAESYELSPDKLVYTIKLRGGVKFHTGGAMTAKDVAYSYNYIRDPKNGSPGAGDFASIRAIDAVDDATVKITLSEPNASLPMTLGNKYGAVVPAGYFDDADAKTKLNQTTVGTGPFKLAEFKPNSNLTLVRNSDYWEHGAPYLDRINIAFLPNSASMLVALSNKRVDLAVLTRPQDVRQVERVAGLAIERWPSLNQKAIDLGSEYGPLADVRVRQAIALGIDKDEVMRASIGGLGKVIGTMVAAMQDRWGLPLNEVPNQKPDPERAKKLLAEAGHANGLDLTLTTIIGYDWMDPAALTVRDQLGKIGVRVAIQRADLGVWIKNFQSKQMGFTFNDWATQPDPEQAKKLLAEAGHANGLDLTLTTIIGYDWMDPAALTVRDQLGKIGVRVAIQRADLGVWIKNFQSKQMGFTFNDWATQPDPNLLFYRHFHMAPEGADFRNWKDEAASKLLDEGRAESELAKRKAIYAGFQKRMAETVPTVMLFSADHVTVRTDRVKNYVQHPTGWYYGLARTYVAQ